MASPWLLADQQRRRAAQAEELARLTEFNAAARPPLLGTSAEYGPDNPNAAPQARQGVEGERQLIKVNPVPQGKLAPGVSFGKPTVRFDAPPQLGLKHYQGSTPDADLLSEFLAGGAKGAGKVAEYASYPFDVGFGVSAMPSAIMADDKEAGKSIVGSLKPPFARGKDEPTVMGDLFSAASNSAGKALDPDVPALERAYNAAVPFGVAGAAIAGPSGAATKLDDSIRGLGPLIQKAAGPLDELVAGTNAMARKVHQSILSRAKEAGRGETLFSLGGFDAARLKEIKEQITKLPVGSNEYKNLKAEQKALSQKSMADDIERSAMERAAQRTEEFGPEQIVADMKIGGEEGNANLTRPTKKSRISGKWRDVLEDMPKAEADEAMAHNAKVAMLRGEEYVNDLKTKGKLHHEKYTWLNDKFEQIKNYFEGGLDNPIVNDVARHVNELAQLKGKRGIKGITADVLETKRTAFDPDAPLSAEQEAIIEGLGRHLESKTSEVPVSEGSFEQTPAPLPPREPIPEPRHAGMPRPSYDPSPQQLKPPAISPETRAQVQAAAEQAGNPEYAEKLVAKAEEMAQRSAGMPRSNYNPSGGMPRFPSEPPAGLPAGEDVKMPPNQPEIGEFASTRYPKQRRLLPTIFEAIRSPKSQTEKMVRVKDSLTKQERMVPAGQVTADLEERFAHTSEVAREMKIKAQRDLKPAMQHKDDHEFIGGMQEVTDEPVPGAKLSRWWELKAGLDLPKNQAEADMIQSYNKAILEGFGKEAEYNFLLQHTDQGPKPFKAAEEFNFGLHHMHPEFLKWMKANKGTPEAERVSQIIADMNNKLYPKKGVSAASVAEELDGMTLNAERTAAVEVKRKVPLYPTWVTLSDGKDLPILKSELFTRKGQGFPGIYESGLRQADDISYKINFGQDFTDHDVAEFTNLFPGHPAPARRAEEFRPALAEIGLEQEFDRLLAAYFGKHETHLGAPTGFFHNLSKRGQENKIVKWLGTLYGGRKSAALLELGPKQLTQFTREVAASTSLGDMLHGLKNYFNTHGAEDIGRRLDPFIEHAVKLDDKARSTVDYLLTTPQQKITAAGGQLQENVAVAAGKRRFEYLARQEKAGKLSQDEIRQLKEDLKISDKFIERMGAAEPGTQQWMDLRDVFADRIAGHTQFTQRDMMHQGRYAVDPVISQVFPFTQRYLTQSFRRAVVEPARAMADLFSDAQAGNRLRGSLDLARQIAQRTGGTVVDAAYVWAFGQVSGYAWKKYKEDKRPVSLPNFDTTIKQDPKWKMVAAGLVKAQMFGPLFDQMERSLVSGDFESAVAHASMPVGDLVNALKRPVLEASKIGKSTMKPPAFKDAMDRPFMEKWLIDDLAGIFPGHPMRKLAADFRLAFKYAMGEYNKKPEAKQAGPRRPPPVMKLEPKKSVPKVDPLKAFEEAMR